MPRKLYQYADLFGPGQRFATIDYGETPPSVYFGQAIALGDLHLPHRPEDVSHEPGHVEAVKAACPHCQNGLTLWVPHKTVRVGCPACGALLDADAGKLQVASTMDGVAKPLLPIGSQGQISGVHFTVIGYLKRSIKSDSSSTWDEYLLHNGQVGYRWLTSSDGHWSFVEPVPPGDVELQGKSASFGGKDLPLVRRGYRPGVVRSGRVLLEGRSR